MSKREAEEQEEASEEKKQKVEVCFVCSDPYKSRFVLPCLHNACGTCVTDMLAKDSVCVGCQSFFKEGELLQVPVDEKKVCVECDDGATHECTTCAQLMCLVHVTAHKKSKRSANHKITGIPDGVCVDHTKEIVFFCEDCSESGCEDCIEHYHHYKTPIEVKWSTLYRYLDEALETAKGTIEQNKFPAFERGTGAIEFLGEVAKVSDKVQAELKKLQELDAAITGFKTEFESEIEKSYAAQKKNWEISKEVYDNYVSIVESAKDLHSVAQYPASVRIKLASRTSDVLTSVIMNVPEAVKVAFVWDFSALKNKFKSIAPREKKAHLINLSTGSLSGLIQLHDGRFVTRRVIEEGRPQQLCVLDSKTFEYDSTIPWNGMDLCDLAQMPDGRFVVTNHHRGRVEIEGVTPHVLHKDVVQTTVAPDGTIITCGNNEIKRVRIEPQPHFMWGMIAHGVHCTAILSPTELLASSILGLCVFDLDSGLKLRTIYEHDIKRPGPIAVRDNKIAVLIEGIVHIYTFEGTLLQTYHYTSHVDNRNIHDDGVVIEKDGSIVVLCAKSSTVYVF